MDGVIAFCDIEKQDSDMWCEVNTNKIVLDFLKFLARQKKTLKDIKELNSDKTKTDKLGTHMFGKGNKSKISYNMIFNVRFNQMGVVLALKLSKIDK